MSTSQCPLTTCVLATSIAAGFAASIGFGQATVPAYYGIPTGIVVDGGSAQESGSVFRRRPGRQTWPLDAASTGELGLSMSREVLFGDSASGIEIDAITMGYDVIATDAKGTLLEYGFRVEDLPEGLMLVGLDEDLDAAPPRHGQRITSLSWGNRSLPDDELLVTSHPADTGLGDGLRIGGLDFTAWIFELGEDLDLQFADASGVLDDTPLPSLYFSVSDESRHALPPDWFGFDDDLKSGATVFRIDAVPDGSGYRWSSPVVEWAPAALGLGKNDDIDALSYDRRQDYVIFSTTAPPSSAWPGLIFVNLDTGPPSSHQAVTKQLTQDTPPVPLDHIFPELGWVSALCSQDPSFQPPEPAPLDCTSSVAKCDHQWHGPVLPTPGGGSPIPQQPFVYRSIAQVQEGASGCLSMAMSLFADTGAVAGDGEHEYRALTRGGPWDGCSMISQAEGFEVSILGSPTLPPSCGELLSFAPHTASSSWWFATGRHHELVVPADPPGPSPTTTWFQIHGFSRSSPQVEYGSQFVSIVVP